MKQKVLVGLSGGIDSAVSAYLLKEQGYNVIGATLKLFPQGSKCCSLKDIEHARTISYHLDIPYYVFDYEKEFCSEVVEPFCESYLKGFTPNPCIVCNEKIKFGYMLKKAIELNCDFIATGHYIIKEFNNNRFYLKKGIDEIKEQSYFLYSLSQEQLSRSLFPLGSLTKHEVKKIAEQAGFNFENKRESYDICFVMKGEYPEFILTWTNSKAVPGKITDTKGHVLGTHKGLLYYTIGQKKLLDIDDPEKKFQVVDIDHKNNIIIVGESDDLYKSEFLVSYMNLMSIAELPENFRCNVRLRKYHEASSATIRKYDDTHYIIKFDEPQSAITYGQAAVFYNNDKVIGGSIVQKIIS